MRPLTLSRLTRQVDRTLIIREEDWTALIGLATQELSRYNTPAGADGNCAEASYYFLQMVSELLPDRDAVLDQIYFVPKDSYEGSLTRRLCETYTYEDAPHPFYLGGCRWSGHCVARVGTILVDWTARQFQEDAPFPLIFELKEQT